MTSAHGISSILFNRASIKNNPLSIVLLWLQDSNFIESFFTHGQHFVWIVSM
ncbi:hypothetical protein ACJX0J_040293, partial [Zea mays]